MSFAAFKTAERSRRSLFAVSIEQRRELKRLSVLVGESMPHVYSMTEATEEIERLQGMVGQPALPGFHEAVT